MGKIPELLVSLSGEKINTKEKWEKFRRDEVLSLMSEYVYGFRDIERPEDLYFNNDDEDVFKGMRRKHITCGFGDFSFPITLYLPIKQNAPVPTFIFILTETPEKMLVFDEKGNMVWKDDPEVIRDGEHILPIKDITEHGFGIALFSTYKIYPDWQWNAEFKQGVFAAYKSSNKRQKNSWAGISAWSWGASRVLDYLETDLDVDAANVAVAGFSRGGKAALWAAATDGRFKLSYSNNSGCAGAALLRGKTGEHIKDINISDWFCDNYHKYNDAEEMLPVDQHMLISLIAPRYVYVTSSLDDIWADPYAEYRSCQLSNEVFELYGIKGLDSLDDRPRIEVPYREGHIAYHVKIGDHSMGAYDWENVIDYFDKVVRNEV